MVKREKIVITDEDLPNGKHEFRIHEITFAGQMRLQQLEKVTLMDTFKQCMPEEDFKMLDKIPRSAGEQLSEVVSRVNGWNKQQKSSEDFTIARSNTSGM